MDGRPRPGLPSGEECCKQSDPEQFGCPSILRLLDVYGESETQSTLCTPASPSFVSPCGLGEGERKFIFNLVTTPAFGRGVITESSVIICACQPFIVMFCCLFFFAFFIKLSNRSVVNPCLFHKSLDIL